MIEATNMKQPVTSLNRTRVMVYTALFTAVASIMYIFFEFPIPFFLDYLRMDFSDTIALIGGITLGPAAGIFIQVIKNMIKMIMGSYSGGIGELANALVGIALILPPTLIYRRKSDNRHLLFGLILGIVSIVVVAGIVNFFVVLPLYMPEAAAAEKMDLILVGLTPFNLFKGTMSAAISFVVITSIKEIFKYIKVND